MANWWAGVFTHYLVVVSLEASSSTSPNDHYHFHPPPSPHHHHLMFSGVHAVPGEHPKKITTTFTSFSSSSTSYAFRCSRSTWWAWRWRTLRALVRPPLWWSWLMREVSLTTNIISMIMSIITINHGHHHYYHTSRLPQLLSWLMMELNHYHYHHQHPREWQKSSQIK